MAHAPCFDYYEEVRIKSLDPEKAHLNGRVGVVLGRTETEDKSSWYYAINLHSEEQGWCFFETELEPTGNKFRREDFYDGTSIRVQVDERGKGRIVRSEDKD
jgi:Immunity protein 31